MISRIIDETKIKALRKLLDERDKVVITCHVSPDGDAIGSSLALYHVLSSIGKSVKIVTPDMVPKSLLFLPGVKEIVPFSKYRDFGSKLLSEAELIFCLDFNSLSRVDEMSGALEAATAPKVLIDHHLYPEDFAQVTISHPEVSSTCMLLFRVLCRLELFGRIKRAAAECIYTGMMTDTGNFTYNSNDPDLYVVIAELLKKGVDKDRLYSRVCNTNTVSSLRLNSYAIYEKMQLFPEHHAALISLTREELTRFEYQKGDTEGLVNIPLSIPGISYSLFMREDPKYIKVSARSKGEFAVNKICEKYFGGGGHKNAAGGEFVGTLSQAVELFDTIMSENDAFFNE